jgi:hypothetical protein
MGFTYVETLSQKCRHTTAHLPSPATYYLYHTVRRAIMNLAHSPLERLWCTGIDYAE